MASELTKAASEPLGYSMDNEAYRPLAEELRLMLGADAARISTPGSLFLVIGTKRRSKGEWRKYEADGPSEGTPLTFDYLEERVVASGADEAGLRASAAEYKRLLGMTTEQRIAELLAAPAPTETKR